MAVPAASLEPDNELAEVLVATTWDCNLRCSYCFVQEQGLARAGERMSPEVGVRLIDVLDEGLRDVRSVCVHLYGGEPLTNLPVMAAMLERAADKPPQRFQFAITTNGTVLTDEAIRLLGKGSFQVVLSIDGPARIHDECRRTRAGEATHARVLEFLCALRSRTRCRVRGSAVVRSGWSLAEAVGYLRGLPVDTIKAQAVRGPEGTAYALSPGERDQYLRDLETIGREVISELEQGQLPKDDRFSARVLQLLAGMSRERFCAAGDTTFGITPAGGVFPCVLVTQEDCRLGHVNDDPAHWRQAGRRWRQSRAPRAECTSCPALALCGGGCPAILPVCGAEECELVRKNCEVAVGIYDHFRANPEVLLGLAGIT